MEESLSTGSVEKAGRSDTWGRSLMMCWDVDGLNDVSDHNDSMTP